jgi:hypothetical protein
MKLAKKKKDVQKEEIKQLDLGIKEPFKNKFFKIKGKTDSVLLQIEVKKFLKDVFFWFVAILDLTMLLQQGYVLYTHFAKLPNLIPILNYYRESNERLVGKEYLFVFPAITFFVTIVGIVVVGKYYNREKVLSKFILFCTLLTSIATTILLLYLMQNF